MTCPIWPRRKHHISCLLPVATVASSAIFGRAFAIVRVNKKGATHKWGERNSSCLQLYSSRFGSAVTFVIDQQHHNYVGASTNEELVHRLATAVGSWGSSAEYLFRTADTLRARGIPDPKLEKLARLVRVAMAKMQTGVSA